MLWFKRICIAAVLITACALIFVFCLRNNVLVDVDLLFYTLPQIKLDLLLIATFIAGGLLGVLSALALMLTMRRKYRVALSKAQRQQQLRAAGE